MNTEGNPEIFRRISKMGDTFFGVPCQFAESSLSDGVLGSCFHMAENMAIGCFALINLSLFLIHWMARVGAGQVGCRVPLFDYPKLDLKTRNGSALHHYPSQKGELWKDESPKNRCPRIPPEESDRDPKMAAFWALLLGKPTKKWSPLKKRQTHVGL